MIPINPLKKILRVNSFLRILNTVTLRKKYKYYKDYFSGGLLLCIITIATLLFYCILNPADKSLSQEKIVNENKPKSIQEKIRFLDNQTTLDLVYNDNVEYYITLYLNERRESLEGMLQRSEIYFPVIEAYLDKYELPFELKYLAALESGLNPTARSRSGALGLWQFLYSTCNLLDLEVTTLTDDRYDIYVSTDAACRYLEYLYRIFDSWDLALAAYNDGPGTVERAIIKSGGIKDYWKLREYLPFQSSEYVPAFIAFNYLFNYYADHGVSYTQPKDSYKDLDTIYINSATDFKQIAQATGLNEPEIRLLNPKYKKNYIPKTSVPQLLILPDKLIAKYLKFNYKMPPEQNVNPSGLTINKKVIYRCKTHVVQKGEFYHKLAMKYNCTIEDIKYWNRADSNELYPGQVLIIWSASQK